MSLVTKVVVKPILAGMVAYAGDVFILKQTDMVRSSTYAACVAGSIFLASLTEPTFTELFAQPTSFTLQKSLAARSYEVALSTSSSYLLNKYVLLQDPSVSFVPRVLNTVAADIISEGTVFLMNLN